MMGASNVILQRYSALPWPCSIDVWTKIPPPINDTTSINAPASNARGNPTEAYRHSPNAQEIAIYADAHIMDRPRREHVGVIKYQQNPGGEQPAAHERREAEKRQDQRRKPSAPPFTVVHELHQRSKVAAVTPRPGGVRLSASSRHASMAVKFRSLAAAVCRSKRSLKRRHCRAGTDLPLRPTPTTASIAGSGSRG